MRPRVGREILDPTDRLGLPSPSVLRRARTRAAREGASPHWLKRMGVATGVVADLHPGQEPDLVLRFDLDALEIPEAKGLSIARRGKASHPAIPVSVTPAATTGMRLSAWEQPLFCGGRRM